MLEITTNYIVHEKPLPCATKKHEEHSKPSCPDSSEEEENKNPITHVAGSVISCVSEMFSSVVDFMEDFLASWFEQKREEEDDDEKKELEKQCKEREKQKEEIKKLCRQHKLKHRKSNYLYGLMEEAKRKMYMLFRFKESLKSNIKKYKHIKEEEHKSVLEYDHLKNIYKNELTGQDYYHDKEEESHSELLPSYVCEHEPPDKIDLDLIC